MAKAYFKLSGKSTDPKINDCSELLGGKQSHEIQWKIVHENEAPQAGREHTFEMALDKTKGAKLPRPFARKNKERAATLLPLEIAKGDQMPKLGQVESES